MLPYIKKVPAQSSIALDRFGGINITPEYKMGELCNSLNLDSSHYPALGSRKKRKLFSDGDRIINGIGSHDGIYFTYTDSETSKIYFNYNNTEYDFSDYSGSDDYAAKRYFAEAGGAILIIPDKVLFDITDLSFMKIPMSQYADYQTADAKFESEYSSGKYSEDAAAPIGDVKHDRISAKRITYYPTNYNGYDFYAIAFSGEIHPGDMIFVKMRVFSDYADDDDESYKNCITKWENGVWLKVKDITETMHRQYPLGFRTEITELIFDDNTLDVLGRSDMQFKTISIERTMPDVERIISYNNRIWGIGGDKVYTSRLGCAYEWNDFSIDSYGTLPSSCFSASAGTPGDFTAIYQHGSYVYAFKENYIHKIYGDTPDEYSFSNLQAPGCIKNADTVSVCGNYLVYASHDGICILRDGYPKIISKKIGEINPICAASYSGKYYLLCDKDEERVIYVYDIEHDIWTMETASSATDNIFSDARTIICSDEGRIEYLSEGNGADAEDSIDWSFSLRFDRNAFEKNTSVRAVARIDLAEGASFLVRTLYDDGSEGRVCYADCDSFPKGRATLRLPLKRDLGFNLYFEGRGDFEMRSIKFNYYKSFEE